MVTLSVEGLVEAASHIAHIPGAVEKASKSAVRKTLTEARRDIVRRVKSRYTSPIGEFTSALTTKVSGTEGKIEARGRLIPLSHFQYAPKSRITQRGVYIKAAVLRGGGRMIKSAFKHGTLLSRVGQSRLPLKKLFGPAPAEMLNVPEVREPVMDLIERQFQANFISEVNKFL